MARVFAVPNYRGATQARYGVLVGHKGGYDDMDQFVEEAMIFRNDIVREMIADECGIEAAEAANLSAIIDGADARRETVYAVMRANKIIAELAEGRAVLWDSDAVFAVLADLHTGRVPVTNVRSAEFRAAAMLGDAMFATGYAGGLGSPGAVKLPVNTVDILNVVIHEGSTAVAWVALADELRLGAFPASTLASAASLFDPVVSAHRCAHSRSKLCEALRSYNVYSVGMLLVLQDATRLLVLNKNSRYNLAACIYSAAMWAIGAACDEREGASRAARLGIDYITNGLRVLGSDRSERLARSMKSSYAVILCDMQTDLDPAFRSMQRAALVDEVQAVKTGITPWHDVLRGTDNELAIDYGTAWNLLPPADIDASALASSLRAKVEAPAEHREAAWTDFIAYSMSVITARYLAQNRDADVRWASGRTDDPGWAKKCREGNVCYPAHDERDHMVGALVWKQHIETWHHTAQDVTHVNADRSLYEPGAGRVRASVANELLYVLRNGSTFSERYPAQAVRKGMLEGSLPGERVLYCSGKSENTKFGSKVRETMSADDVLRETLTEIDANLAELSVYVGGVAMRAGRAGTELLIKNVVDEAKSGGTLISMDVSGWSPNMDRQGEMRFIDAMMSMFDLPDTARVSSYFRDLRVYIDKHPVCLSFPMMSGSVQGFFGTGDTIIHSMVAQYVLSVAKRDDPALAGATVAKVALIDDILLAVKGTDMRAPELLRMFKAGYARLGFAVDTVKSLAGSNTGVFLNRVYTVTGEITTSAKILAKADREWDRPVVGIFDEVSSVFAGFAGAADRGYSAVRAYRLACFRAATRIIAACHPYSIGRRAVVALAAFLPPGMGGLGVPDITSWISETAGGTLAASISPIVVARDHARNNDAEAFELAISVLNSVATCKLKAASVTAVAASPAGVSRSDFVDPVEALRSSIKAAIKKSRCTSDVASLLLSSDGAAHDSAWRDLLEGNRYDAPLIADLFGSLPSALGEAIMARFIRSAACAVLLSAHKNSEARRSAIVASRLHVKRMSALVADADPVLGPQLGRATEIAAALIAKRVGNLGLINSVIPAPIDVVGHVTSASDFAVYMRERPCRHASPSRSDICRTYTSAAVMNTERLQARDMGPLASAARRLVKTLSFLAADGTDVGPVAALCAGSWGVEARELRLLGVPDVNPRRLSFATSHRNHAVRAYPNSSKAVAVDASRALRNVAGIRTNIDIMAIRAVLTASALVDLDSGAPAGMTRHYRLRSDNAVVQEKQFVAAGYVPKRVKPTVSVAVSSAFCHALVNCLDGAQTIEVVDVAEGRTTVLKVNRAAALTRAATVDAKRLFDAIAGGAVTWDAANVAMGDASETHRRVRTNDTALRTATALRPFTTMNKSEFAIAGRARLTEVTSACDSSRIPDLQRAAREVIHAAQSGDLDAAQALIIALYTALTAATEAGSTQDYLAAMRRGLAQRYIRDAEETRRSGAEHSHAQAYRKRIMADICNTAATPGYVRGATASRVIAIGVADFLHDLRRRVSTLRDDEYSAVVRTIMDSNSSPAGVERAVRTALGDDWTDLADVVAGARGACKTMLHYLDADRAEAPAAAPAATVTSAASRAGGDRGAALIGSLLASNRVSNALANMFGTAAEIPDEFDTSDLAGAAVANNADA